MKDIEVISSLPGSPYFFFKKNGPVKHSNVHPHYSLEGGGVGPLHLQRGQEEGGRGDEGGQALLQQQGNGGGGDESLMVVVFVDVIITF